VALLIAVAVGGVQALRLSRRIGAKLRSGVTRGRGYGRFGVPACL